MDFSRAPVLVEFGFGLVLIGMGACGRAFPRTWTTIWTLICLGMLVLAYQLAAPYACVVFLVLLVARILNHPAIGAGVSRAWLAARPVVVSPWTACLVALSAGVFLIVAPAHIMEAVERAQAEGLEAVLDGVPNLDMNTGISGRTDKGNEVGLYTAATAREPDDLQWLREHDYGFNLLRLGNSDNESNCHGHVFTGGRYWVLGRDVPAILRDNGYEETANPAPGDLVVYREIGGTVAHTGIVRATGADIPTLVESKWGKFGVYIHPVDRSPYSGPRAYFRTNRPGGTHLLSIGQVERSGP